MKLRNIDIHPALHGCIDKMWVFESSGKAPTEDMKLVVPNGLIKLVVPFRNGVSGKINDYHLLSKENKIILIGISDLPAVVDIENDSPSGSIGIEFSPRGAYRFFRLQYSDVKNQIHPLADILDQTARRLEEQIADEDSINNKIRLINQFLLKLFFNSAHDPIYDYCTQRIQLSRGNIAISQLEKETGYSTRWLRAKFSNYLGIGPKDYASIIRFQQCYSALLKNSSIILQQKEFYDYYYDQSHFIKEFKKFTGLSPKGFEKLTNNFGRIFYRD
jgi:AraC-like DNA-binding protein